MLYVRCFLRLNVLLLTVLAFVVSALPARAQVSGDKIIPISMLSAEAMAKATSDALASEDLGAPPVRVALPTAAPSVGGGKTLVLLQAGMAALQAMDLMSTRQALNRPGAFETNPTLGGGSLPATIAVKAASTAGIILLTNHIAKTNRVAAVVTMVALNSAYATIAAHNFAIAHGR
jgi:hypothetical protein